ncbi:MAG: acylphosphatase [Bacteroidota bacterium]
MTKHLLFTGNVQGVGFRAYTRRAARTAGVTGWVRNLADGRVEILLQGDPDRVDGVIQQIAGGPPTARVESMIVDDVEPGESFDQFTIRH